ncbi:MAG: Formate hydrogenlyase subunit 3/multisubunit Na+/H+ antiporter, MnhD subunit [Candidatus Falkowbacteria bacterium GW2011_GWF2_39_8]|uniref:Formate hydrogenlyase subunit 3/multisubunit Na+/H+ antiporter, MnhD subunit n=1 Tax=Candidatus Falkowbacteria bacterium GW2011_GWF2_39_8 TaxID=1618642 RepID=A0A0G0PXW3_9BACT|nr:MAG: Formate hydrogenlyase subunit 3/multisubunit Na+/H+ antiporter, MnhD subunit [Candidatus Falkowbacteria bacterium GW2011_GWF2_39_8]
MIENYIIYCVAIYSAGLIIASLAALIKGSRSSSVFFIFANIFGSVAGLTYLFNFSGQALTLANFNWLFQFSPRLNFLSAIFFTAISIVSALVGIYSIRYLKIYDNTYPPGTVQALTAIFVLGMQGVLLANNVFVFLFFWEVMSITSFFLVMADRTQESLKAAFLYFIMTHLGASAIMGGFLILSQGSLLFDLNNIGVVSQSISPALLITAFILFLFGFGSKAGLVPFHVWLPEAHPQAPSNISAMMSGLMLKVAVYGFIMVVFNLSNLPIWASILVIFLGLLSGLVGVLYALIEKDIKRIFAYSSIENMGIIFTMLGFALYLMSRKGQGEVSLVAVGVVAFAIFHAVSHMFFKTALFLSSGVIISRVHTKSLEMMGGLAKLMPVFAAAFLFAILGSLPIAPAATFYGEWGFIQTIVGLLSSSFFDVNEILILLIMLTLFALIGGLAVFAMVRVFGISMLGLPRSKHLGDEPEKNDMLLIAPIFGLIALLLTLGIVARPILDWLMRYLELQKDLVGVVTINSSLSSLQVAVIFILIFLSVYLFKRVLLKKNIEREYHTWDCGQPINSTMEYTGTAFSAPIRFFFLRFLGSNKMVTSTPIIPTNSWIKKYTFSLVITSVWKEKLYQPIARVIILIADRIKIIQSGRVQYYLAFLLLTLIVTLIITL